MAAVKGKDGGVYQGGSLITFVDSWELSRSISTEETTSFGDAMETYEQIMRTWSARVSFFLDRTDVQQEAILDQLEDAALTSLLFRFATDRGSSYWEGSAIIESDSINSTPKGMVKVSANLRGDGALSWTSS